MNYNVKNSLNAGYNENSEALKARDRWKFSSHDSCGQGRVSHQEPHGMKNRSMKAYHVFRFRGIDVEEK